jgi:hypothetical protein
MPESAFIVRRFDDPDEHRDFPLGRFDLVQLGGMSVGRAEYEPGWRWSEHVGAAQGKRSCEIGPGHDSAVIGDEPYVSIHLLGAEDYAAK